MKLCKNKIYEIYLAFIEGEDSCIEYYPAVYKWVKDNLFISLTPEEQCRIWNEVSSRPYTWDLAGAALKVYEEQEFECSSATNKLKAMDYGHICCSKLFSYWGCDTENVRKILKIGAEAIAA